MNNENIFTLKYELVKQLLAHYGQNQLVGGADDYSNELLLYDITNTVRNQDGQAQITLNGMPVYLHTPTNTFKHITKDEITGKKLYKLGNLDEMENHSEQYLPRLMFPLGSDKLQLALSQELPTTNDFLINVQFVVLRNHPIGESKDDSIGTVLDGTVLKNYFKKNESGKFVINTNNIDFVVQIHLTVTYKSKYYFNAIQLSGNNPTPENIGFWILLLGSKNRQEGITDLVGPQYTQYYTGRDPKQMYSVVHLYKYMESDTLIHRNSWRSYSWSSLSTLYEKLYEYNIFNSKTNIEFDQLIMLIFILVNFEKAYEFNKAYTDIVEIIEQHELTSLVSTGIVKIIRSRQHLLPESRPTVSTGGGSQNQLVGGAQNADALPEMVVALPEMAEAVQIMEEEIGNTYTNFNIAHLKFYSAVYRENETDTNITNGIIIHYDLTEGELYKNICIVNYDKKLQIFDGNGIKIDLYFYVDLEEIQDPLDEYETIHRFKIVSAYYKPKNRTGSTWFKIDDPNINVVNLIGLLLCSSINVGSDPKPLDTHLVTSVIIRSTIGKRKFKYLNMRVKASDIPHKDARIKDLDCNIVDIVDLLAMQTTNIYDFFK